MKRSEGCGSGMYLLQRGNCYMSLYIVITIPGKLVQLRDYWMLWDKLSIDTTR